MSDTVEDGETQSPDSPGASGAPSPSPWATPAPPAPDGPAEVVPPPPGPPPTWTMPSYEPPGPYEQVAAWQGPSAYEAAVAEEQRRAEEQRAEEQRRAEAEAAAGAPPPAAPPPFPAPPAAAPPPETSAIGAPPSFAPPPDRPPTDFGPPTAVAAPGSTAFDPSHLLRPQAPAPSSGFRRVLFRASGGRFNLGPSSADRDRAQLLERARTPAVTGRRRIAMISLKGGVGKTTTTVMLGHTLATVRGDNVIAVDANPDAGNLAQRVRKETDRSARDLLAASDSLDRYADVRAFTSQATSRLEVLAGDADPALSEAFSASDYEAVLAALERFYSIVLTDCGTGILHDAMRAVLWYVDQLIVVTSAAVDSAQALGQLLDWLDQHGYHHLVQGALVAVNMVRKKSPIRVEQFAATFGTRCRGVVTIPYDPALATGGESSLEATAPVTRQAYLQLAAAVGDGFGQPRLHGHDPRPAGGADPGS